MPSKRRHEALETIGEARDGDALLDRRAAAGAFLHAQVGVPGDQSATVRNRLHHRQRTLHLSLRDHFVGPETEIFGRDGSSGELARRTPELAVPTDRLTKTGKFLTRPRSATSRTSTVGGCGAPISASVRKAEILSCTRRKAENGGTIVGTVRRFSCYHRSGTIKGVAAIYNRYEYRAEQLAALEAWSTRLAEIASGEPAPSNVIDLGVARGR